MKCRLMFSLAIFANFLISGILWAGSVVFYSGSFDPPTRAHFAIIQQAMMTEDVEQLYISVNRQSATKDFNASVQETHELR